MCDASEHEAGSVLLTEDYTETNDGNKKTYAPVAFGSQRITEGQMSLTMYAKKFQAMHLAFDEFAHILLGVKKPTIVMTDNKALTRFFQSKRIPPKLWNHCDQALQFDLVLAHVPGLENPTADYLSRLDINPEDRIHLKLNDQIPVHYNEIDLAAKPRNKMTIKKITTLNNNNDLRRLTPPSPPNKNSLVQSTSTMTSRKCNPCCIPSHTASISMTTTVSR